MTQSFELSIFAQQLRSFNMKITNLIIITTPYIKSVAYEKIDMLDFHYWLPTWCETSMLYGKITT